MIPTVGRRDGPERAPAAPAEELVLRETADRRRHEPLADVLLAAFDLDGGLGEFRGLGWRQ